MSFDIITCLNLFIRKLLSAPRRTKRQRYEKQKNRTPFYSCAFLLFIHYQIIWYYNAGCVIHLTPRTLYLPLPQQGLGCDVTWRISSIEVNVSCHVVYKNIARKQIRSELLGELHYLSARGLIEVFCMREECYFFSFISDLFRYNILNYLSTYVLNFAGHCKFCPLCCLKKFKMYT